MLAILGQSNTQPFIWGQWGGLNADSVASVPYSFAPAAGGSQTIPVDLGSFPNRMAGSLIQSMLIDNTMNPGVLTVTILPIGQSFSIPPFTGQIVPFPAPSQRFTALLTGVEPNIYVGQIQFTSMNWQPTSWAGAKSGATNINSVTTQFADGVIPIVPSWLAALPANSKRVQLTLSASTFNNRYLAYSFDGVNQAGVLNPMINPPGPTVIWAATQGPLLGGLWIGKGASVTTAQTIELSVP